MTIAADWTGVLCILLWGWWFCRLKKLPGSFGPVLGAGLCMVVLQLAGGYWYAVLFLLFGAVFTATRGHRREFAVYLASPGVLGFLAGVVLLELLFAVRAPRFQTWDEFSHWGVFFKNVFYERRFAVWETGRSFAHQAYPQGGAALYALFGFFRQSYAERDVFFALDTGLLAAGAALFGVTKPAGRRACTLYRLFAVLAVPLLFFAFIPDTPYNTAYMDALVGAFFAAALALLFVPGGSARDKGWVLGILCAAITTLKEIGGVLALCVLGIWLVQCLLLHAPAPRQWYRSFVQKAFWVAWLPAACTTALSVAAWRVILVVTNRTTDQFSSMGTGYFLACFNEARTGVDPYFYDVWNAFYTKVRTAPLLFGWSTFKLGLLCAVFSVLLAVLLIRLGGPRGLQLAAAPLLMLLYFPCYLFVLFYVYIGGMSPYEAMRVASYERYACCFFIGWFALLLAAAFALTAFLPKRRIAVSGALVLSGLLAVHGVYVGVTAGSTAYALPHEAWRDTQIAAADTLHAAIPDPTAPIWLLSADEDNAYQNMWYYQYELYPDNVCIEIPSGQADVDLGYNFDEHHIQSLVLFGVTDDFAARYAAWFTDGLAAARTGAPAVYTVAKTDGGVYRLTPVT